MSEDTAATPFPTRYRDDLIDRYNTHRKWMIDAKDMAKNAMPKTLTDKMKCIDWKVTLINFLKFHPGRNGFPLNYAVGDNVNPIVKNNSNFLDDHANRTPFQWRVFTHNEAKVQSYILFIWSQRTLLLNRSICHIWIMQIYSRTSWPSRISTKG